MRDTDAHKRRCGGRDTKRVLTIRRTNEAFLLCLVEFVLYCMQSLVTPLFLPVWRRIYIFSSTTLFIFRSRTAAEFSMDINDAILPEGVCHSQRWQTLLLSLRRWYFRDPPLTLVTVKSPIVTNFINHNQQHRWRLHDIWGLHFTSTHHTTLTSSIGIGRHRFGHHFFAFFQFIFVFILWSIEFIWTASNVSWCKHSQQGRTNGLEYVSENSRFILKRVWMLSEKGQRNVYQYARQKGLRFTDLCKHFWRVESNIVISSVLLSTSFSSQKQDTGCLSTFWWKNSINYGHHHLRYSHHTTISCSLQPIFVFMLFHLRCSPRSYRCGSGQFRRRRRTDYDHGADKMEYEQDV